MFSFDAEQLSFENMKDKDNITWVTIRGNHVPIPKGGTREQKAQAIKEWFANKKKELPQGKGRVSFYSAKVEHDAPKRTARKSGEGVQVHGEGQYTLKHAENNYENYFKKFGLTKRLVTSISNNFELGNKMHGLWGLYTGGGNGGIKNFNDWLDRRNKRLNADIEKAKAEVERLDKLDAVETAEKFEQMMATNPDVFEEYKDLLDNRKYFANYNDLVYTYNRARSSRKSAIREAEEKIANNKEARQYFEEQVKAGNIWEESSLYTVNGKMYSAEHKGGTEAYSQYAYVNSLYRKTPEERESKIESDIKKSKEDIEQYKQGIESYKKQKDPQTSYYDAPSWYIREYEQRIKGTERQIKFLESLKGAEIKSAKAQMSKVQLPASKTYIREATNLNKQSGYVKDVIKKAVVEHYGIKTLREQGYEEKANEIEGIVDYALSENVVPSVLERKIENIVSSETGLFSEQAKNASLGNERMDKKYLPTTPDKYINLNNYLYDLAQIKRRLQYSFLAMNKDEKLVMNNGRGFLTRFGVYHEKGNRWKNNDTLVSKVLGGYGLSGIAYRGHGVSRVSGYVDGDGNVTFNPDKIKVLEKTTEVDKIKQWIEAQKKIGQTQR